MRDTYGWVCLILGAALVLLQFLLMWQEAATRKKEGEAHQALTTAARRLTETSGAATLAFSTWDGNRNLLQDQVDDAVKKVGAAQSAVTSAANASASSKWDTATALASRVPLAVAGIVMIALGALITGNLDLSATASTK